MDLILFGTFFPTTCFKRIWNHISVQKISHFLDSNQEKILHMQALGGLFVGWRGLIWLVGFIADLLVGADWWSDRVCASVIDNAPSCILMQ